MTMIKEGLAIAAALMLISTSGVAQSTPRGGTTTTASSATAGSFESLSPGNQKIVRALFLAQRPSKTGPAPLSLNQIAALKGSEGWGQVFKQMKTEGLVQDKNLGQVVSSYEHHVHGDTVMNHGHTVTTGRDHDVASGSGHGRGDADRDGPGHGRGDADRDGRIADEDRNIKGDRGAHDADRARVTTASGASAGGHSAVGGSTSTAGGDGSHDSLVAHGR